MSDEVQDVQRWVDSGGTVKLLRRTDTTALLALCTCDGGEEQGRVTVPVELAARYLDGTD